MPSYDHVSISSSAINAITYDEDTQLLTVEFTDGTDYVYDGVPDGVATDFLNAGSKGAYFNANIRNHY